MYQDWSLQTRLLWCGLDNKFNCFCYGDYSRKSNTFLLHWTPEKNNG